MKLSPYNPVHINTYGLGCVRFARRYSGHRKNLLPGCNGFLHHLWFRFWCQYFLGRLSRKTQHEREGWPRRTSLVIKETSLTLARAFTWLAKLYQYCSQRTSLFQPTLPTFLKNIDNQNHKWFSEDNQKESSVYCFLFLQVLRCFTSLRALPTYIGYLT